MGREQPRMDQTGHMRTSKPGARSKTSASHPLDRASDWLEAARICSLLQPEGKRERKKHLLPLLLQLSYCP
eukprot:752430-Hanusia_phi.AAC.1